MPTEVISILDRRLLTAEALAPFEEAWRIFVLIPDLLGPIVNLTQLRKLSLTARREIAQNVDLAADNPGSLRIGTRTVVYLDKDTVRYTIAIRNKIAAMARTREG